MARTATRSCPLTVGIAGLGGGGSHVAQQLAHVGIGRFVLPDYDRINETNLNRLVSGMHHDVQHQAYETDIAARVIRAVNPEAQVTAIAQKWQEAIDALRFYDVIFGNIDNVRGKEDLEAFRRRLLIPYIDQGMDVHALVEQFPIGGQVVLSITGAPCLRCLGIVTEEALGEEGRNYGAAGGKPQMVWPNGILALSAAGLFLHLVMPWYKPDLADECLEYDGNPLTVQRSDRMRHLRAAPGGWMGSPMSTYANFGWRVRGVCAVRHEQTSGFERLQARLERRQLGLERLRRRGPKVCRGFTMRRLDWLHDSELLSRRRCIAI